MIISKKDDKLINLEGHKIFSKNPQYIKELKENL